MSRPNVKLVRRAFAAYRRRDIDQFLSYLDPEEFELHSAIVGGHFRFEAEEYRELDSERVLVLLRRTGRGKASGLEVAQIHERGLHLFCIRGGKVTRLVDYLDRERALADLGLAPEAESS